MNVRRVLYLTHYAELYGANRSLLDLIIALRQQHVVDPFVVLAYDGPLRIELERLGIAHQVVSFEPWMHKRVLMGGPHHRLVQRMRHRRQGRERDRSNNDQQRLIVEVGRRHDAEMVHTNSSVIGIGGAVARGLGVPHVWHIRELPFLHYGFAVDGGIRRYAQELRRADGLIALSQAVVHDMRDLVNDPGSIHIVPNGIVTEQVLKAREQQGDLEAERPVTFTFLLAALFHPAKGQEEAVKAFAEVHRRHANTRLVLAGDGRTGPVKELVEAMGLANAISFPGFVEDLSACMAGAQALLQCSRHEALGRTVLEAMAAAKPVVGHASGATPELVEHGVTGLLYTTQDELVEHMCTLVQDPSKAAAMGSEGRKRVHGRYTVEAMVEKTLDVYHRVLEPRV